MSRRDFVAACVGLAAAWLTGMRMNWRAIFAPPAPTIATGLDTFNAVYRKIQGKLLKGFNDMQPEWDAFMETELGRLGRT